MRYYLLSAILVILILCVFHAWFLPGIITGGDLWYSFPSMSQNYSLHAYAWYWNQNAGMGGAYYPVLWSYFSSGIPLLFFRTLVGYNWQLIERLGILFPYILLGVFSSVMFYRKVFKDSAFAVLAPFLFVFNTYILMVVGGGQLLIAFAYGLAPIVIIWFIEMMNRKADALSLHNTLIAGLLFSVQVLLDLRIGYVTFLAVILYGIVSANYAQLVQTKNILGTIKKACFVFLIPLGITVLLHAFWILPTAFSHENVLQQKGNGYVANDAATYYSFATFENTVGLLHPNWPDNIFGQTSFMKPEFLLLPVLAFGSLFFIGNKRVGKQRRESLYVLFFALLGIVGSFLAKGTNEPFGSLYLFLFNKAPGFVLFRDPTKWYLLIALSYSMLIPYTFSRLCSMFDKSK